jgi:predicted lipid carrier protein YhbT
MASIGECERAFHALAERLAAADSSTRKKAAFDRTLSCTLRDLDVTFTARLHDGRITDIRRADSDDAQVRLTTDSSELLLLVNGDLALGSAWVSGRVKIDASVFDLLKLRTLF